MHRSTAEDITLALQPCTCLMAVMSSFPPYSVFFFKVVRKAPSRRTFTRMALALSLGAGIPVHSLRAPARCISTKLVENYKHTQGHSGAEPASHRAHLIQPETRQLPPSACLRVGLQLFHYLFEQIGLRLVCGGLIVTRDERLQRAVRRAPGFAEPLCCVKRVA